MAVVSRCVVQARCEVMHVGVLLGAFTWCATSHFGDCLCVTACENGVRNHLLHTFIVLLVSPTSTGLALLSVIQSPTYVGFHVQVHILTGCCKCVFFFKPAFHLNSSIYARMP